MVSINSLSEFGPFQIAGSTIPRRQFRFRENLIPPQVAPQHRASIWPHQCRARLGQGVRDSRSVKVAPSGQADTSPRTFVTGFQRNGDSHRPAADNGDRP